MKLLQNIWARRNHAPRLAVTLGVSLMIGSGAFLQPMLWYPFSASCVLLAGVVWQSVNEWNRSFIPIIWKFIGNYETIETTITISKYKESAKKLNIPLITILKCGHSDYSKDGYYAGLLNVDDLVRLTLSS